MVEFNYDLPHGRIAMHPMETRHASKLLTYKHGEIIEDIYADYGEKIKEILQNNLIVI